jgi:hypothetical protein
MVDAWFQENLKLTCNYLQKNVSDDLWNKVSETYDQYKPSEQGGPLFFIIVMKYV